MVRQHLVLGALFAVGAYAQTFDWSFIQPSKNFSWVSCYSGRECARFSVPLNYSDASQGDAAIAVTRIKSNYTGSDYLGPIFFNPGGPGDSGVDVVVSTLGSAIAATNPQFDIVSFDPRGVSHSTPAVSFFSSEAEKALWLSTTIRDSNASSEALSRQVAQAKLLGQLAKDRDNGILSHTTTDNVARDMLQMVEAYGEQNLRYWGVSYGTVLGTTFATMFPDRVGRMLIDGVVDVPTYFSNNMTGEILDADKEVQHFINGCFTAGPSKCAFYGNASSPDDIASSLNALYSSIRTQPIPAYSGPNAGYGLVDYDLLHSTVFNALYVPYSLFTPLASALEALKAGNATQVYELSFPAVNSEICNANETASPNSAVSSNSDEARVAYSCADGSVVEDSLEDLQALMASTNMTFYGEMLSLRAGCIGWQFHPEHFAGPVGANTSFPLMLIGNTADPVTPLADAQKMSQVFPGSVVLQQDSLGHTSLAASSNCTQKAIRTYFVNGTLPQPGTVCEVENELFVGSGVHV